MSRGLGGHAEILAIALLSASLAACPSPRQPPSPPAGVILLLVDALRADHLGCYGYRRQTSPHIDALAGDGARFANAVSPAPWTLPTLGTLMTSLYPSVHGAVSPSDIALWMRDRQSFRPVNALEESRTTLAEVLRANGFATAAFINGSYPGKVFGFAQGFDQFADNELPGIRPNIEALLDWIDAHRSQRFFVYLHTKEVHSPYAEPPGLEWIMRKESADPRYQHITQAVAEEATRHRQFTFDAGYTGKLDGSWSSLQTLARTRQRPAPRDLEHLLALYDQGIAYTDYWIGQLVGGLQRRHLYDRTVLIVTADHGDEFFDHGGLEHSKTFYEEMMHVPLVLRVPGEGNGRVIDQQVGLIDVMPTVLDVLDVKYDGMMQGISLRPALRGAHLAERPMFGEASHVRGLRATRTNQWKYIRHAAAAREELYDLRGDPRERTNLCAPDPARCASFRQQMEIWEGLMRTTAAGLKLPAARPAVVDERTRERLRSLGYVD